jgi:hypothetical protein
MADVNARMERIIEEMAGNEALLEMLETDAAREMLNWGIATAKSMISRTRELDDFAAELAILPRLKAIRQSMRSIGNWAAGKYTDPEDRRQLREKLLGNFRTIFGERRELPSARQMDEVLDQVDDKRHTPHELILKMRDLFEQRG